MATLSPLNTITIFLLVFSLLAAPLYTSGRLLSKIYAFGDSYTDTGNTRSATGPQSFTSVSKLPYGTTFFHRPTNRYSDGRLVIDFLASEFSLPFLPPYLHHNPNSSHGVNFAVAGATAIDHDFFVKNNLTLDITPQSLTTELKWFDKYLEEKGCRAKGTPECNAVFKDALFWVGEIGANDYAYTLGSAITTKQIRDLGVNSVARFLQVCSDPTICLSFNLIVHLIISLFSGIARQRSQIRSSPRTAPNGMPTANDDPGSTQRQRRYRVFC